MTCEHCLFACTAKGEDMTLATFYNVIKFGEEWAGDYISLGGGEPTIHPKFWEILGLSIGHFESVWLATNGSVTRTALALARMAANGVIGCRLSLDSYHDEIDACVEQAFEVALGGRNANDAREISRGAEAVGANLINSGRCDWGEDRCPCDTTFIKPNGDIHVCGCEDSPKIGSVNEGGFYPSVVALHDSDIDCSYDLFQTCHKSNRMVWDAWSQGRVDQLVSELRGEAA